MQFVTFNPFRTIGIPNTSYIKPENMLAEEIKIKAANWVLFPEYWQVNSLVYGWHSRIFPSINTYHLGHDKVEMTRLFQAIVPDNFPGTMITASGSDTFEKAMASFSFPIIAKKVRSSEGRGISLLKKKAELAKYLEENQIIYLQEYLPIDRDLRVVVIGDKIFSAYWRIGAEGSFVNNVAQGGQISYENIPGEALELVQRVCQLTGIDHAGFDLAVVDGQYYFLEFNLYFGNQGLTGQSKEIARQTYHYLLNKTRDNNPDDYDQDPQKKLTSV